MKNRNYIFLSLLIIFSFFSITSHATEENKKPEKDIMKMDKCYYMDYFMYHCKPYSCMMPLPIDQPDRSIIKQMVVKGKKDNLCYYNTKVIFQTKDRKPIEIITECKLSPEGIESLIKEFNIYKNGNLSVYLRGSQDNILQKECKIIDY